jgi:RluA family pseudouridine synthase
MTDPGFEILLEDDAVLAVDKPAGVATQAPPGIDTLEVRIRRYLALAAAAESEIYLGIPHRLDRPVSGAMVFAKTRRAARQLSRQFERRRVAKTYWAAVEGHVEPASGTWTDHLWKVHGQPRSAVVESNHPGAQIAILHYRVLGQHHHGSWLQIVLETGRTHQVRIQAASRGFLIVGDAFYGSQIPFGEQHEDERLRAIALHARSLTFWHPTTHVEASVVAPLSPAWNAIGLSETTGEIHHGGH